MARGRVLDTSYLISWWRRRQPTTLADAASAGAELVSGFGAKGILTPVKLEFLAGARTGPELELYDAFLSKLVVLDKGQITPEDWEAAARYLRRITGRPRGVVDCLIRAIAERLGCDVLTTDLGFPRRR